MSLAGGLGTAAAVGHHHRSQKRGGGSEDGSWVGISSGSTATPSRPSSAPKNVLVAGQKVWLTSPQGFLCCDSRGCRVVSSAPIVAAATSPWPTCNLCATS